jgi:type VI secretion system protein ImpL
MRAQPTLNSISRGTRHALTLPATWQGIVDDCRRVRGRRVGMAWEQTRLVADGHHRYLGAGLLLSFALNRMQIVSVAEQAMPWWSILPYRITN